MFGGLRAVIGCVEGRHTYDVLSLRAGWLIRFIN